jgi:hypothetical protein
MGYGGVWVITGMGYDRFDCTRVSASKSRKAPVHHPTKIHNKKIHIVPFQLFLVHRIFSFVFFQRDNNPRKVLMKNFQLSDLE